MDKVLQLIGLSQKSRHLVCGTDSVVMNLQKKKLHLIFIASDASPNLIDKITKKAFFYQVPVISNYDSLTLQKITGKKNIIMGLDNEGLAQALLKEIRKADKEESNYEG